ncbi:MAG: LysM peptidoglycan-binding domain-containing protein [Anaerolineales bacterium]
MSYKLPYTLLKTRRGRSGGGGRSRIGFYLMAALSLLLIAAGLYVTTTWVSAGGVGNLFPSDTPTPTATFTPSTTPTITSTPTVTPIPNTATASAPFPYTVELGDTISSIADKFGVDFIIIMVLNGLNNDSVLFVGQQLVIPDPNMQLPTPTALPTGLRRGDEIGYLVLAGDTLDTIAIEFFSTVDAIMEANELTDPNQIFIGQLLIVPVNLVTATPGPSPTPVTPVPTGATATATP